MSRAKKCGNCRHLLVRDWQLTHGTCEWVDAKATIAPKWLHHQWPTMRKDDGAKCKAWAATPDKAAP